MPLMLPRRPASKHRSSRSEPRKTVPGSRLPTTGQACRQSWLSGSASVPSGPARGGLTPHLIEDRKDLLAAAAVPMSAQEQRERRTAIAALVLLSAPTVTHADQKPLVVPLPISTPMAQAEPQCCRVCKKGKACGDGCISAKKQCRRPAGCACSVGSAGS